MASADVRQELDCSICLNIYTDPVTLRCGHNFCLVCIDRALDTQEGSGVYSCPECRAESQERPVLEKNRKLCNIAECVRCIPEEIEVFCTYCVHTPVRAVKTCLKCEASLCEIHWRTHNKSVEHILIDPTTSLENRKCSVHKKILEYYCTEDAVCICVSCNLAGEHRGHLVELLDEAAEKIKKKLRIVLQKLTTKRQETEERVQRLQESRREESEKASDITERVTVLFRDIRIQLEDLEKRVLVDISRQEERGPLSISDLIQQLEIKKDDLTRRMHHIEEVCNMSDPVTVLQKPRDWLYTEDRERQEDQVHSGASLDVGLISGKLQTLSDIITGIKKGIYIQEATDTPLRSPNIYESSQGNFSPHFSHMLPYPFKFGSGVHVKGHHTGITFFNATRIHTEQRTADISLDINTASNNIQISDNKKTATWSHINQKRPNTAERFQYHQVMSSGGFTSGRHYWEVEVRVLGSWKVGMCYPSIDRRGRQSYIGDNKKSWCLGGGLGNHQILLKHDKEVTQLPGNIPCDRVRIRLDYEAGQLSFYSLCDPIRHLHTFSTTFTEPLHAILSVYGGCIKISG